MMRATWGLLLAGLCLSACGPGLALPAEPSTASQSAAATRIPPSVVTDFAALEPPSAEAAAANRDRTNVALAWQGRILRGTTAGLVVEEILGSGEVRETALFHLPGEVQDLALFGTTVLAACGPPGIFAIDLAVPSRPRARWRIDTPGGAIRLAVEHDRLAVADGSLGVELFSLSGTRPVPLARHATRGYARGVLFHQGRLVVAEDRSGVSWLQPSTDGSSLEEIARLAVDGAARALAAHGEDLLVAAGAAGVIRIAMPDEGPLVVARLALTDLARDIAYDDRGQVFVAAGDLGLVVAQVEADQSAIHSTLTLKRPVNRVTVDGGRLLLGNDSAGLAVVELSGLAPRLVYPPPR